MREMAYEYVKQNYDVNPEPGMRVTLNEKGCARKTGVIVAKRSYDHYVHVRFGGTKFDVPCHPLSLEYEEKIA
jgi:hypothetical protein